MKNINLWSRIESLEKVLTGRLRSRSSMMVCSLEIFRRYLANVRSKLSRAGEERL